jgi:16S rRNA (guanine527-N7)-methyltransferase
MRLSYEQWLDLLKADRDIPIDIPGTGLEKISRVLEKLQVDSEQMNLTSIREETAIVKQHVADSLAGLSLIPDTIENGADLGSGAGFPLFPLAALRPQTHWTAIESVRKKCDFITSASNAASLNNISVLNQRGEDVARSGHRASFEVVTSRAVGVTAALCETALPLLKIGGILLLYKTELTSSDLDRAEAKLAELGGSLEQSKPYQLEGDRQNRILIMIRKNSETPEKYPRAAGVPFKKPLWS